MIRVSVLMTAAFLASCATGQRQAEAATQGEIRIESRSLLGDFQTTVDAVKESDGRWTVHESRTAFRSVSHKTFRLKRAEAQKLEALLDAPGLMDRFEASACLDPPSIAITLEWRGATETSMDDCESPPLRSQLLNLLYRR
jgi:predicted membrane chloride channel (bestrophin family)